MQSLNEQKKFVKGALLAESRKGDKFQLINQKWWDLWKKYVKFDLENKDDGNDERMDVDGKAQEAESAGTFGTSDRPMEIDNSGLLGEGSKLKPALVEAQDYAVVPATVGEHLIAWYGGGPVITRTAIEVGVSKLVQVEIYLLNLVVVSPDNTQPLSIVEVSKGAALKELIHKVSEIIYTPPHKCHLKIQTSKGGDWTLLQNDKKELTIDELGIVDGTRIFGSTDPKIDYMELEQLATQVISSKFPLLQDEYFGNMKEEEDEDDDMDDLKPTSFTSFNSRSYFSQKNSFSYRGESGAIGLNNLGNTCFMNSSLQCLSNTEELTNYFLNDQYHGDINRANPLGTSGRLVEEYAKLLRKLWKGTNYSVSPSEFKWAVGRYAPQFEGYRQHDSQEFLAFVLDGLHEDLNRVKVKPYVEIKDSAGRPDDLVSRESWDIHLSRNQSIVVELFHGQLKSKLVCPDQNCDNVSITFDPFVYLSLPLPDATVRTLELFIISYDVTKKARKCRVRVPKQGSILQVKEAIVSMNSDLVKSPEDLILADIFNDDIHQSWQDDNPVNSINPSDTVFAYHIDAELRKSYNYKFFNVVVLHYSGTLPLGKPSVVCFPYSNEEKPFLFSARFVYSYLAKHFLSPATREKVKDDELMQIFSIQKKNSTSFNMNHKIDLGTKIYMNWHKGLEYSRYCLKDQVEDHTALQKKDERESKMIHLEECLKKFQDPEKLGKSNEWYCSKCKQFQQATKQISLFKFPKILVIHLKRFQFSRSSNKINTMVHYPFNGLDLSAYDPSPQDQDYIPPIYDLFAVSVHRGDVGGGHYTAYALHPLSNKWYHYNDSSVSEVHQSDVLTEGAYMLFYKRRPGGTGK